MLFPGNPKEQGRSHRGQGEAVGDKIINLLTAFLPERIGQFPDSDQTCFYYCFVVNFNLGINDAI